MRIIRDYEVSIWTLQDSFITVLKPYGIELKGQLQEPDLKIVDDGTIEFSFNLPMYYTLEGQRLKNPLWDNVINGTIVANMRKAKIIFKKHQQGEKVIELMITKVVEKHEKDELMCEVSCEGLAFHELGKIGYKIALETDDLIEENYQWFKGQLEWPNDGEETETLTNAWKAYYTAAKNIYTLDDQQDLYIIQEARHFYKLKFIETGDQNAAAHAADTIFTNYNENYEYQFLPIGIRGEDGKLYPIDQPRGTLQYWNDKVFKLVSGNWKWNWTYEIQMDYSNNLGKGLESNKVYEDAYVSSWDYDSNSEMVVAQAYVDNAEKERVVDLKESNVYNLTQDLAKTFGVFCRYEYEHDENYHICGRKVIYYNNFIIERLGALDITYPYDTSVISRTSDSTDLVTKLYVQTDGSNNDGEPITITNSSANKTREDYILNFDYLWRTGAITQEQYAAARQFETDIYCINNELIPIQNQIIALEAEIPELEGKQTILKNSIMLDQEQMAAQDDLLNALTDNTGVLDITNDNPKTALIITNINYDANNPTDYPNYIKITELGIDYNTLKIYKKYNTASHKLSFKVEGKPQYDEFNNLVLIHTVDDVTRSSNATWEETDDTNNSPTTSTVYMIYQYSPELQYKRVKQIWKQRLKNDENDLDATELRLLEIKDQLINLKDRRDELLAEKELEITRLERTMGAALREGYWQPEDYNDYGDKHLDNYQCTNEFIKIEDTNIDFATTKFFYDQTAFDSEQKSYIDSFTIDDEDTTIDYPCIKIEGAIKTFVEAHPDDFSFIFYDVTDLNEDHKISTFRKIYHIGSQCKYAFMKSGNNVIPVIMITGAINDHLTSRVLKAMVGHPEGNDNAEPCLAIINPLTAEVTGSTQAVVASDWLNLGTDPNYDNFADTTMIYPRIQITSLNIRTDNDEILVKYNGTNLENYEDYQLLIRDNSYYVTLKPEIFARLGYTGGGQIQYIVSNANTMIYLDALQVSKENSQPKVEYSVTVNAINQDFIEEDYNYLGYIAHINDTDLKFENVYGYVSELHLKLDKPWEDEVTIKNYKTKFEDLFTSIVAQTEQMQKNSTTIGNVGALFDAKGDLIPSSIEKGINKLDLTEAFNKGTLTWDDAEGLWASSDSGVVAIRGGGIFAATQKNPDGSWHWNTGLTPEGINADLITTGQLDTNRIKVYAGDELRLQLNADGLFAYKTGWDGKVKTDDAVDYKQYVVHDASGLFLIAENGAQYKDNEFLNTAEVDEEQKSTTYAGNVGLHNHKEGSLERVAISWDGLTLRNWAGQRVFYANPDTGDLVLIGDITANNGTFNGTVNAANGNIGGWTIGTNQLYSGNNNSYVALNSDSTNTYAIWAGATNAETTDNDSTTYAPFSVSKAGQLRASDAIISGAITATSFILSSGATISGLSYNDLIDKPSIPDPSSYVINGLSMMQWGSVTPKTNYLALTSEGGLLFGANNGIVIPRFTPVTMDNDPTNNDDIDNTDVVMAINSDGISFNHYIDDEAIDPDSYIHINSDGISLSGSNIEINNKPIWSHENIVIMNPNATGEDAWRKTVSTIESEMAGKTDWVLIRPFYNSTILYKISTLTGSNNNREYYIRYAGHLNQSGGTSQAFGEGAEFYDYVMSLVFQGPMRDTSNGGATYVSNFTVYLSNTSLNINNYDQAEIQLRFSNSTYTTNAITQLGYTGWQNNANQASVCTLHTTGANRYNLCKENSLIYYYIQAYINIVGGTIVNTSHTIKNIELTCSQDQTTSRVPCTVYYYP